MSEDFSSIKEVEKIVHLALPITYISNEIAGIKEILEGWRKKYNPQLEGILVNYCNVSLISRANKLVGDKIKLVLKIKAKFILFCPYVGDIAKGRIKRISKEHVGCIMHDTINAVIKLTEYYPDELKKYMRLNQDILFEITNFDRRPKEIFVVGKITENCLELMNELIPLVPEENATDFGFLNQNVIKRYDFDGIEIVPVKNEPTVAEVVNIDTGSEEGIMKTKKRERDSSVSEDSEPRKKKKRKKDKSVQNLNISQDAVVNCDLSTISVKKDSSFSDDSKPKKKKKKDKSEHSMQDLNISLDAVVNCDHSMISVDRDSSFSGENKPKKRKKQKKDKSEHSIQDLNKAQDFAINGNLNLISIKQENHSICSSSEENSSSSDNLNDNVENENQPVKKSIDKNKSTDKKLKPSKKKKKKIKDEKKSNKKNSKKGKIIASGAILKTDKKSHKKKHSSKGNNKNKKDKKSKIKDKKRKKSKHKDKNPSTVSIKCEY